MLRMVNLLIALSLGVHREQLLQRMGLVWPRPFLLRPLFFLCSRKKGQVSTRAQTSTSGGDDTRNKLRSGEAAQLNAMLMESIIVRREYEKMFLPS